MQRRREGAKTSNLRKGERAKKRSVFVIMTVVWRKIKRSRKIFKNFLRGVDR